MKNFIDKGIDWFNKQCDSSCVESVYLTTATVAEKEIKATVLEPESNISSQGLKVTTDKYVFLVDKDYLVGIDLKRGLRFRRGTEYFEVVIDRNVLKDYNDPNNTRLAISAKLLDYIPS